MASEESSKSVFVGACYPTKLSPDHRTIPSELTLFSLQLLYELAQNCVLHLQLASTAVGGQAKPQLQRCSNKKSRQKIREKWATYIWTFGSMYPTRSKDGYFWKRKDNFRSRAFAERLYV